MTYLRQFILYAVVLILGPLCLAGLSACQADDKAASNQTPERMAKPGQVPHAMLPDNVTPTAYRLDLSMDPDAEGYSGVVEIDVLVQAPTRKIWIHGKNMSVTNARAALEGGAQAALTYTELSAKEAPSGIAYLTPEAELPAGKTTLILPFETPYNLALDSAYKMERGGEAYIVTQFEAMAAREAFPSFDEPRFKVPFDLAISAPAEDVVIATSPKRSVTELDNGWLRHEFTRTRPLPTYLLAFAVGPYDVAEHAPLPPTEIRAEPIPLRALTAKGDGALAAFALKHTAEILEALEAYFDVPYKYEKLDLIAAPEFAYGAMENPGAIVYREYLLLMDETAPLTQKRSYFRVHAHELAHQWFGNLVTPFWWEDIWLNEAFATWMSYKIINQTQPRGNYGHETLKSTLSAMGTDSLKSTRKVREPLLRSENVIHQFDSITYRKGGGVLSMFEAYLGEDVFRDGVRLHMQRFADKVATADDFFKSLADASQNAYVVPAMKSFVDQPGLPLVAARLTCPIKDDQHASAALDLSQMRYAPLGSEIKQGQKWQIPVCAKFGYEGGELITSCTLMTGTEFKMPAEAPGCAQFVMPNAMGAGYYRFALDDEGWASLIANIDRLDSLEVLSLQDSLDAALQADKVSAENYFKAIRIFANHPDYDVVSGAGDMLGWIYTYLPQARGDLARLTRDMYAGRFAAVEGAASIEGQILAPSLASKLLRYGQMDDLEARFSQMGAAYLGLDGPADKKAVPVQMLGPALAQVMRERGAAAVDPLLEMLKNGSAREKGVAAGALGVTKDGDIAARLRQMAVYDASSMTGRQARFLLGALVGMDAVGQDNWQWVKDNFDVFVTERVPEPYKPRMPSMAPGCSGEASLDAETFFTTKADIIPGYERSLDTRRERIDLCAAFKNRKGAEIVQALSEE